VLIKTIIPALAVWAAAAAISQAATGTRPALPSAKATLQTFAGEWYGHTRSLTITKGGVASESIGDGCCNPVIDLKLKLSRPRGVTTYAVARVTVIAVTVRDPAAYDAAHPAPHIGQIGQLHRRHGVVRDKITGATYCNQTAGAKGLCGA
jgi:hypothetical protein